MQRLGFIHDMLDVKVLILFVTARANYPMSVQEIYETCYVDDCLSYFDVCTAIPEMVTSGHLRESEEGKFVITEKGREDGETTADSIAFTVRQKAEKQSLSPSVTSDIPLSLTVWRLLCLIVFLSFSDSQKTCHCFPSNPSLFLTITLP